MKRSHGGARHGAGAKKGSKWPSTIAKDVARELVRARITEELLPLVDAQIAKGLGISYLVTRDAKNQKFVPVKKRDLHKFDPKDVIEVWEKTPDTQAFNTLADRALDRPKEQEIDVNLKADWDKLAARLASARAKEKA